LLRRRVGPERTTGAGAEHPGVRHHRNHRLDAGPHLVDQLRVEGLVGTDRSCQIPLVHQQIPEAESHHLRAGHVARRMLKHVAGDVGAIERRLLALQRPVDRRNRVVTQVIDTEHGDGGLTIAAVGKRGGHLAPAGDMADELAHGPTVAGSLELPLIGTDLGDE